MKVTKHCEWCGEHSQNAFYRFIGEVENEFLLDSPLISKIDTENKLIILKTGQSMTYFTITSRTQAASVIDFIPHIFCREQCEDAFIQKPRMVFGPDMRLKTPVVECHKNGIFKPLSMSIESLHHQTVRCETCNNDFPNLNKSFLCRPIIDSKTILGTMSQPPMEELSHFEIAFSDMNEKHPNGTWYLVQADEFDLSKKSLFCSNECVFEYAESKNSLVMFKNNMMNGLPTSINPYTVRINQGLGNKNIYYPQKIQQ
jgi:hypothetical protein